MDANLQFLQNLILALLLGSVVGVEREKDYHENGHEQHEFGGIRTMALVGMLGYLLYYMFANNMVLFATFTSAFLLLLIASYLMSSYLNKNSGATTEFAALFVYLMGILIADGKLLFAASVTLIVVLLLYFKEKLHDFAANIEKKELYDAIKFIAVVFIILPLLPNQTFDPLEVLNPYLIWLIVVLISSISFISYIAIKLIGPKKGIGLGGFLGGLMSSTALSISFANLSQSAKKIVNPFVFGILIACSAMFVRVLLEIFFINRSLVDNLLLPFSLMGGLGIILSLFFWWSGRDEAHSKFSDKDLNLKTPLQLGRAIEFALLLSALLFITKYVTLYYGNNAIFLTSFLSGIVDVDAITVSMANLNLKGDISDAIAACAITITVVTNTMTKALIVFIFASPGVAKKTALSLFSMGLVGLISIFILYPELYGAY